MEKELKVYIMKYLREIGINTHLAGYKYLTTAILYCAENTDKVISMNEIYLELNKKHNVKKLRAERDIRYALKSSNLNIELKKVTNKRFIYSISQIIYENSQTNERKVI